jgi:hypothetical protein
MGAMLSRPLDALDKPGKPSRGRESMPPRDGHSRLNCCGQNGKRRGARADRSAPTASPNRYGAGFTGGIFHEPSMIDGSFSFGQYMRNIKMKRSAGAGSQLASLSLPGDSC